MIMNENYTENIDIWAVGVLAYELVKGKPPFEAESSMEIFSLILDVKFEMPEEFSEELKDFVRRILVKDQMKRIGVREAMSHEFIVKHNRGRVGLGCNEEVEIKGV